MLEKSYTDPIYWSYLKNHVIPEESGIHSAHHLRVNRCMDSRFHGNDSGGVMVPSGIFDAASNMMNHVCALALLVIACSAGAQSRPDYPKRPVRFIVAQTPGGNADFVGRIIAEALGKRLGQQFVVDNRPGASGIIASEITVKAPPDGYTLLLVTTSFGVNPALYKKLPYDSLSDLVPITHIAYAPQILVVSPSLRVQSVKDLVELARAKPGALNYGVSSIGGATQLAADLFSLMARVKMTLIPYKGAPAMLVDLMRLS